MVHVIIYLIIDGILNTIHNVVAFTMISLVSPLSYSIANSSKRIVVIATSIFILQNPVTKTNIVGMSLALLGVILYNKVCSLDHIYILEARQYEMRYKFCFAD
jgi:solute carrier family 35 protein E1